MRICYDNLIELATGLSMTNLDNDSVVTNLYHPFLELACFCTEPESVLTGSWSDAQDVNVFALAFMNANFARLTLYDFGGNEVYSQLHILPTHDTVIYLDQTYSAIYSFKVEFSGGEDVYVGYVFLGKYLELPRFGTKPDRPIKVRSSSSKSLGGQVYGVFAQPLTRFSVEWPRMERSYLDSFLDYIATVQTCKPHLVDLYPEAQDSEPPLYCNLNDDVDAKKRDEAGFFYTVSAEWEEAR